MTMEHVRRSFGVSLNVSHPTMNPAEITRALGFAPRQAKAAGLPRKPPFDQTWWSHQFDCRGIRDLVPFLEQIAFRLAPCGSFLASVAASGGAIELFCGIRLTSNWDEDFPPALLMDLAALHISLRLDVYPDKSLAQPRS